MLQLQEPQRKLRYKMGVLCFFLTMITVGHLMNVTNQYAPGAPMEDARMEGNALVTTKIARVDNEAIIPAKTCNHLSDLQQN